MRRKSAYQGAPTNHYISVARRLTTDLQNDQNCLKPATRESLNSAVCICFTLNSIPILEITSLNERLFFLARELVF